ncbi:MAG: tetratricopeptide repeat protein [Proteobacteria bacterium]|nr:tetratricopeptide repeat protein [Burkholderiales bacterium]
MNPQVLLHWTEAASEAERAGDLPGAVAAYRQLVAAVPRNAELVHRLGFSEYLLGNLEDAIEHLAVAARLDRRNAGFLVNLGLAQHAAGRHAEAVASLRKAVALKPDLSIAHNNLGLALSALGEHRAATTSAARAVTLAPRDAQAHYNLGNAHFRAGDYDQAHGAYQAALALAGPQPELLYNLGNAQHALQRTGEAMNSYRAALQLDPDHVAAWINLGNLLMAARAYDAAEHAFEQGAARDDHGNERGARATEARYNLANLQRMTGRLEAALESYRAVLGREPMHEAAYSNLLLTMNYSATVSRVESFAAHVEYGRRFAPASTSPASAPQTSTLPAQSGRQASQGRLVSTATRADNAPLRIGFVSPDLRRHAVALFAEPIFEHLPHYGFEVHCYFNSQRADEVTARLRGKVAGWRDIAAHDDAAVADLIVRDRIDVLVDLAGHTAGHRLRVFARRPAPVQVTMIGHVNTTGVDAIDYRITDAFAEPSDDARDHDRWYTEKLIRLPHSCWCMRAPERTAPPSALMARAAGAPFTFGSFNNYAKLSPRTLDLWTDLLGSRPDTRLIVVTVPEGQTQTRLRERFARSGVDPARLEIHGLITAERYRALHDLVDLALDPLPCNGATTTIETLWLGVPVLTVEGDSFRSRNGYSILVNAGVGELVARTDAQYLDMARGFADDPGALARVRVKLGEALRTTPLMDEAAFAADLATALRTAWRERETTAPR